VLHQLWHASIGVLIGYVLFMEKRWVVLDRCRPPSASSSIIVIFHQLLPYVFFVAHSRASWAGALGARARDTVALPHLL